MKNITLLAVMLAITFACALGAPPIPPEATISIAPSPLVQGAQSTLTVHINNPGTKPLENYRLIVGYSQENDVSIVNISEVPLTVEAGGVFEQIVPWHVDFQPVPGAKYLLRLLVLTTEGEQVLETSAPLEFAQIVVAVSVNPTQLIQNGQALINVQVTNPSGVKLEGYTLMVGYNVENDPSIMPIQDNIPLTLDAGQTYTQDIPWTVDYIPASGNYEVKAILLAPGNTQVALATTPVMLTMP